MRKIDYAVTACAAVIALAGCGGSAESSGNSNPAGRLLMRTGAKQYVATTDPKLLAT